MPKKRDLQPEETVQVSLGIQLLGFAEAQDMADKTWAGAEEILETVDFSRHPTNAETLRDLLDRGWESDSVTGLLLGIWMRKTATAAEIAGDLLSLEPGKRRTLTALYAAGDGQSVTQYSVTSMGNLVQYSYSRKSLASPDIKLFSN